MNPEISSRATTANKAVDHGTQGCFFLLRSFIDEHVFNKNTNQTYLLLNNICWAVDDDNDLYSFITGSRQGSSCNVSTTTGTTFATAGILTSEPIVEQNYFNGSGYITLLIIVSRLASFSDLFTFH